MLHHSIGQLLPREGQPRAFAQFYIHDGTPEAELEYRQQHLGERSLPELVLFSHLGKNGWQLKISHNKGKGHVAPLEFCSYRLMVRGSLSYLHLCGRLFHQYLVDMYAKEVGRNIILPSSYTGSPRQMYELYQDAMSIIRKFGKQDIFITFRNHFANDGFDVKSDSRLVEQQFNM